MAVRMWQFKGKLDYKFVIKSRASTAKPCEARRDVQESTALIFMSLSSRIGFVAQRRCVERPLRQARPVLQ